MDRDELAKTDAGIIDECKERYALAQEAEEGNRKEALNDIKFANGEQWEPYLRDERFNDRRPYLTINITDAVVRRVVNACRQNRPRIKVHPVGEGADVQTSQLLDGLIRHVENLSGADHAYDCGVEYAIRGGWGYLGVDGDFISPESFEQELKILAFPNPFQCYMDPASRAPDGSDMGWFIETELMKRTEYRQRFGEADGSWNFLGSGDVANDWSSKEEIRVAKYWRIERVKDVLYQLSDGRNILKSKFDKEPFATAGITVVRKRETVRKRVACYLLSPAKILERREWPGTFIPRVPVYGRSLDVNGRIERKGMVRDLRDVARMYNYAQTAKTEAYALQPKAPWLMAEGQMEGHEAAWRDANRKPTVALPYKPVQNPDGTMAPPPMRQEPPQPNAGFAEWGESTKNDFLAVAGMPHDPGQDKEGEVVSGIAIRRRQGISDISHYDFYDNLTRSLRQLGRIIVELIPYYYDTQRMQRIIREDGTPETVEINQKVRDPQSQALIKVKNDLTVGRYDVYVDTGPSYQTKREESAEAQLELLATPLGQMVASTAGDLVVRSMDFPNSDSIADRLQAAIPAAQMDTKGLDDMPPKAKAMISGLQTQLKQANQKTMALELELQAKHGLEQMKQTGETQRVHIKEAHADYRERLKTETTREDTLTKAHTAVHDTHVKAVTAHDVAEINAAAGLMNTHVEATHQKELAKETAKAAEKAERKTE